MGAPSLSLQTPESIRLAMDAQPGLITQPNAGIPAFLSTQIDPKIIDVLFAPMKAAEIVGDEVKKGDWTSTTEMFIFVETTGEVSAYGDYSNNGRSDANVNFPQRQSFHYQTVTEWGEKEIAIAALARIDLANKKNMASVLNLNKYQNLTYFLGVAGLENYGLLNDPSLLPAITPLAKTEGGVAWAAASSIEVYNDILALYSQLVSQASGLMDVSDETPMTLALSATSSINLKKTNQYNVNVLTQLQTNFPNMKIVTAPEYATASGNLVQLIVDEYEGQRTAQVAFTEKLRAHPMVVEMSSFKQKKSQGTWGCIIYRPMFIAQLLGV